MALAAPSSVELWSGDADLEPLVLTMYRTYEKQLNHKECVAHLRKAEWRIDVALGLGKIDLQQRKVRSMEAEVQAAQAQLQAYEDERAERELAIHREAMENAEAYAGGQEALVMAANDAKAREMVVQLGTMEAAVRASEARAVRAEQAVADADERQAAATRGLRAEVSRLEAEVAAREALRDENVRLRQQIAELRLGGRATKMAIADEYEAEISMSRLLWEVCSPTHRRELYATQDVVQRDAVGRALTRQLEAARQACGALLPMLWEHVARTQALAKALDVEPELEQLAEEARRSGVGPADVDRIARELTRMERAEQSADLAQAAAAKSLAAAEEVAAKAKEHLEGLEAAVSQLEEEHPGIFEPKTAAEASENDGKLTPEEIEAASLMERLLKARGEWERETAVGRARAEERGERQTEHRRCAELMQGLRRERSHWREGPTLPERISVAEAREQRLQALYDERAAGMAALHTKIRFLYHERAPAELLSCSEPYYAKAERMVKDLEGLVHQRAQDIMASRRRIQSLVRDLKTRQWLWSSGKDQLQGWQHNAELCALLNEEEPSQVRGFQSETARARLEWARDREVRLIARRAEADSADRSLRAAARR